MTDKYINMIRRLQLYNRLNELTKKDKTFSKNEIKKIKELKEELEKRLETKLINEDYITLFKLYLKL